MLKNEQYSRGIALTSALSTLKQAVTELALIELREEDKARVLLARTAGTRIVADRVLPPDDPERAGAEAERKLEETFAERSEKWVQQRWGSYEKYIDRDKEQAFLEELGVAVKAFNESTLRPVSEMFRSWLQSSALAGYFIHNFDTGNILSGLCYLQSVTDCVEGMQEHVSEWLHSQLSAESFSDENFILRALIINNEKVASHLLEKVRNTREVNNLPWSSLMGAIKDAAKEFIREFTLKMENYIKAISSGFVRLIDRMLWSKPVLGVVAMVASSGYGLKVVTLTGKRKYFVRAVLQEVARMGDTHYRHQFDRMRHHLDKTLRKMELDGIHLEEIQERRFMVLIDEEECRRLAALPDSERHKHYSRVLRSADDVTDSIFPRFYRSKIADLKRSTVNRIAVMTGGAVPFWGCMASLIFQGVALKVAAGDKELLSWEKGSRFGAGVVVAFGTTLELAERALNELTVLRLKAKIRVWIGAEVLRKVTNYLQTGVRVCSWFALIPVGWDFLNGIDYGFQGDYGMMTASFISAVGGGMLVASLFGVALGPLGLAWGVVFIFGSAIYMALAGDNDIQKWLKSCLWRKANEGLYKLPLIFPSGEMEIEAFNELLKPAGN